MGKDCRAVGRSIRAILSYFQMVRWRLQTLIAKCYPRPVTQTISRRATNETLIKYWDLYMVLGRDEGQRFWFADTFDVGTLYLLEVVDGK